MTVMTPEALKDITQRLKKARAFTAPPGPAKTPRKPRRARVARRMAERAEAKRIEKESK